MAMAANSSERYYARTLYTHFWRSGYTLAQEKQQKEKLWTAIGYDSSLDQEEYPAMAKDDEFDKYYQHYKDTETRKLRPCSSAPKPEAVPESAATVVVPEIDYRDLNYRQKHPIYNSDVPYAQYCNFLPSSTYKDTFTPHDNVYTQTYALRRPPLELDPANPSASTGGFPFNLSQHQQFLSSSAAIQPNRLFTNVAPSHTQQNPFSSPSTPTSSPCLANNGPVVPPPAPKASASRRPHSATYHNHGAVPAGAYAAAGIKPRALPPRPMSSRSYTYSYRGGGSLPTHQSAYRNGPNSLISPSQQGFLNYVQ